MSVHPDIDSASEGDESFASRWSRRKQESRPDPETEVEAPEPREQSPAAANRPTLTDADMPDPDSLEADSDFAAFMSPGVSEQLRAQALRRLFHMTGLHTPDGLDDYDEDFTRLPGLGDTLTHDMRRMLARDANAGQQSDATAESQSPPESISADTELHPAGENCQHAENEDPEPGGEPDRPA